MSASSNGYLFDFPVGPPVWEVNRQFATTETRILIFPDGTQVVNVQHNGASR